jgi:hypothetical protein
MAVYGTRNAQMRFTSWRSHRISRMMHRRWRCQRITQVYGQKLLNHIAHLVRLDVKWLFRNVLSLCIMLVIYRLGQIFRELTKAKAAPLYVWWYISLYSSSLAASSAAVSTTLSWLSSRPGATDARRDRFFLRCSMPAMRIAAMTTRDRASLFLDSVVGSSGCSGTVATCDRVERLL